MSREQTITIPSVVRERVTRGTAAMEVLLVAGASILIALSAQVAIPVAFSPVPLTLQPLAILLVGAALGSTRAAAAAMLYLMEGISGLPVFAQGHAGPAWLLGPTAGFLYAFPIAAWTAGRFSERGWNGSVVRALGGMLVALGVLYAGGWSWLAAVWGLGPRGAAIEAVAPFLIGDLLKVAVAACLVPAAQRIVGSLSPVR
jgi:biotin transport system substrate-specific component